MKREYTYDFLVEHTIYDVSKQVGKSKKDIEELSSFELRDLYVSGSGDLDCGDIEVDDEYYREPEYYQEYDELFALFSARYTVTVEGKNEEECDEKAGKAFEMSDFGDYEFVVNGICERDSREIAPEKDNEEETMDKKIIAYNIDWDVDMDEIYELLDNSTVEKAAELLEISPERYAAMTTEERHDYAYDEVHHHRLDAADMVGLPEEVEIPENVLEYYEITSVNDDMSDITDWLSDEYGYCINGYEVRKEEPTKYCVWDRQSEEIVEEFDTIEKADKYIEEIEEKAKEDGCFAPERYVIEEKAAIEQNKVNQSFDEVKEYADFLVSEGTLDADALLDTQYLKDVTAAYMRDDNEYEDDTEKLQAAFSAVEKTECYIQEIEPINKKADIERD